MINLIASVLGAFVVLLLFPDNGFVKLVSEANADVLVLLLIIVVLPIGIANYFYNKFNKIKINKLIQSGKWEDFCSLFKR